MIMYLTKHMKQKLIELQGERDTCTITVGDFNTPLLITERTSRQKTSKDVENVNSTIKPPDLADAHRALGTGQKTHSP